MEDAPVKRRLMAILAADAVGYSRMMGEDEVRTIRVLAGHREVIDALIANYGAKIVGTAGDSVLAEFGSAVDAVRCATEIQDAVRERNEKLPEHDRMWFRIGVNLGDVIVSEAEVHGDGVNVAVRLESIAEPGGVCISSSVFDQISGKLNLGFIDIGEQNLKNIARPIRAYRFAGPVPPMVPGPTKPAEPARRRGGVPSWAWGAAALVLVAAATAWQAGWLPGANGDAEVANAEAGRIEAAQTEAAKAEAVKAEAARVEAARAEQDRRESEERARMEAELARAKAETEAAKKQAEVESAAAADARRSLEAQRASEAKARAEAEVAKARAEAEAIKRDAQAQSFAATRAREQAEASAAQAKALEEAAAKAAADAKAQQQAAATTQQAAAAQSAVSGERRFDGTWIASQACDATRRAPEVRTQFPTNISEGFVRVRRARPGESGYIALDGKIATNGDLALRGMLIVGSGEFAGQERTVHYEGKFKGDRFVLSGEVGSRPCTMELSRLGG